MITRDKISAEIDKLLESSMSWDTLCKLDVLLSVCRGLDHDDHDHHASAGVLDGAMAMRWVNGMQNADGTTGAHWTMDQVRQLLQQKGVQADPLKMWVAMNAEYSDMVNVYRKYSMDRLEVYLDAALARWIDDKDAVEDKLASYYRYIVKH